MPSMTHLTHEYIKALFDYLPEGNLLRKIKTGQTTFAGQIVRGQSTSTGHVRLKIHGGTFYMHHVVWCWHHGTWPTYLDHINNNPSDNRIENLREATHTQNMWNSKGRAGQTGIKGVVWEKAKKRYRVRMRANGKRLSFGYFKTLEEARIAVEAARTTYHGEFARHE